jgi:hypothetical protein
MFTLIFSATAVTLFLLLILVPEIRLYRVSQKLKKKEQEFLSQRAKRWTSTN